MATQNGGVPGDHWRALLGHEVALVRDRYGYRVNGHYMRRVTTLLGGIPKPALMTWAARTVAEFAVEHKDSWLSLPRTDAVKLLKGSPRTSSTARSRSKRSSASTSRTCSRSS